MFSRFIHMIKAKLSRVLDRAESVDETLDYSYEQQHSMLQEVKRGLTTVVASKKQLEASAGRLDGQIEKFTGQARTALEHGREDLARAALERKAGLETEREGLTAQIAELQAQQDKLEDSQREFAKRVAAFRTAKEVTKAKYRAAEAMVQIGEAATGIGKGLADSGRAIERANDRTEQMQARAGAIDELIASGTLEDFTGDSPVDRELRELAEASQVDAELARLKGELAPAPEKAALEQ